MFVSQLKLVGVGTVAVGLIAGALGGGALAFGPSGGPKDPARPAVEAPANEPGRPVQPSAPDQAGDGASHASDVEARLQEIERKLDRILGRSGGRSSADGPLEIPAPRPSVPREPAPPRSSRGASPADKTTEPAPPQGAGAQVAPRVPREGNAPGFVGSISPYGPRGVREIEARLINLYLNYKRIEESPHRFIYTSAREQIEEQVRVLVAQLKEMKDEIDEAAFAAEDARERHQALEDAYGKKRSEYDALMDARKGLSPRALDSSEIEESSRYQAELGILQRQVAEAETEARKLAGERARMARRLGQVDKLITWAESRFKGLAIDDPALK